MASFWDGKKVLITGGHGFIGSHVVERLKNSRGVPPQRLLAPSSAECNLLSFADCRRAVRGRDVVLHLAADSGGLAYSSTHPASQLHNCSAIDLHLVEAARQERVGKVVAVSCVTAYPADAPSPRREEDLFRGRPSDSHLGHGWAKRNLVLLAETYHRQYGTDIVTLIPTNTYGPGDRSDWRTSHVVPSTIWKCFHQEELVVWGDGSARRDFTYVEDVAEAVLLAAEKLPPAAVVNIGSGEATSVRELVERLVAITGFSGRVSYDTSQPSGDPLRVLDTERAKELMGFVPSHTLEEGLEKTVAWYREQRTTPQG